MFDRIFDVVVDRIYIPSPLVPSTSLSHRVRLLLLYSPPPARGQSTDSSLRLLSTRLILGVRKNY